MRDDAQSTSTEIVPFVKDFFAKQRKIWTDKGGELISFPPGEQAAMLEKISTIGEDLSKSKPDAEQDRDDAYSHRQSETNNPPDGRLAVMCFALLTACVPDLVPFER